MEISPKPNLQAITQDLLNEITANNQPLIVVLDDYHEIENNLIHQIFQVIIDFLPLPAYIVITARGKPLLSLPRWRARNWLSDITATDLRFNQAEAGDFLHRTMQFKVSPEAVALLEDRTEGWVAGLQLAALSLANTDFSNECVKKTRGRLLT